MALDLSKVAILEKNKLASDGVWPNSAGNSD